MEGGIAIPLITYQEREGFKLSAEGLSLLNSIEKKVGVISVAGKYRTGKSFLLNRIILDVKSGGFGVGPTINPCTKGIWVYDRPLDIKTADGEEISLLILDTEGLGAFDEDANHDTRIFMLAVLLSSYFIYNSVGSIDENALNNMSLIINLAKNLQIRSNGSEMDVDDLSNYFPSLLWILRDFSLQLIDPSGNAITTKEYLENSLQPQKGTSDSVEAKNRIRKLLKHFFRDRDCFALVRPSEDEKTLQHLQDTDISALRPEFVKQIGLLKKLIYKRVRVKKLNGNPITGKMLAEMTQSYLEAINKGGVPTIEGAWLSVCNAECNKQIDVLTSEYDKKLKEKLGKEPLGQDVLKNLHKELKTLAEKSFKEKAVGEDLTPFLAALKKKLTEKFSHARAQNQRKVLEKCEEHCQALCQELQDKLRAGEFSDFQIFRREFDKKCSELKKQMLPGEATELKLKELSSTLLTEAAEYISRNSVLEHQNNNRKLNQQLDFIKNALDSKKEEFNKEKEYLKDRLAELENENFKLKANLASLEVKYEESKNEKERTNTHHLQRMSTMKDDFKDRFSEYKEKYEEALKSSQILQEKYNSETSALQKDLALAKQEIEWKEREIKDLKARKEEFENEIRELKAQLKQCRLEIESKDELIRNLKDAPKSVDQSSEWVLERSFLKGQLETLRTQLDDNKSVQEALVSALQSKNQDSKSESKDPAKHLSMALEKTEERCKQLEQKVVKLKKYQKIVKSSISIQCVNCGKNFASKVFFEHAEVCKENSEKNSETGMYSIVLNQIVVRDDAPDQKPYNEYVIAVNYKGRSWVIYRRYKNLAMLHSSLQKEFPNVEMPDSTNLFSLGSGSLFSGKPVMRLEDRRKANQDYLTGLASIPSVKNSATFKKFLGIDQHFPEEMTEKPSGTKN